MLLPGKGIGGKQMFQGCKRLVSLKTGVSVPCCAAMTLPRTLLLFLMLVHLLKAQQPAIRAVWVQQLSGEPDPYAGSAHFRLMARELPAPARILRPGPGNFTRP